MVHGSPRSQSNEVVFRVAEQLRARHVFDIVTVGFMECNDPDIPSAVRHCVEQGAREIIAVPYFLHTGRHVAEDLPSILEQARTEYPDVRIFMTTYLGRSQTLTSLLARRAKEAQEHLPRNCS
jgi:sirohydrochlorin ferrochelatase